MRYISWFHSGFLTVGLLTSALGLCGCGAAPGQEEADEGTETFSESSTPSLVPDHNGASSKPTQQGEADVIEIAAADDPSSQSASEDPIVLQFSVDGLEDGSCYTETTVRQAIHSVANNACGELTMDDDLLETTWIGFVNQGHEMDFDDMAASSYPGSEVTPPSERILCAKDIRRTIRSFRPGGDAHKLAQCVKQELHTRAASDVLILLGHYCLLSDDTDAEPRDSGEQGLPGVVVYSDRNLNASGDGQVFLVWQRQHSTGDIDGEDLAIWEATYGVGASPAGGADYDVWVRNFGAHVEAMLGQLIITDELTIVPPGSSQTPDELCAEYYDDDGDLDLYVVSTPGGDN